MTGFVHTAGLSQNEHWAVSADGVPERSGPAPNKDEPDLPGSDCPLCSADGLENFDGWLMFGVFHGQAEQGLERGAGEHKAFGSNPDYRDSGEFAITGSHGIGGVPRDSEKLGGLGDAVCGGLGFHGT